MAEKKQNFSAYFENLVNREKAPQIIMKDISEKLEGETARMVY